MSRGTVVIRVKERTKQALDIFQAMQVIKVGRNLTIDEALWQAIEMASPETIRRVEELEKEQKKKK